MVKHFKYIMWDLPLEGEVPVIFPNFLNHSDFVNVHPREFIVSAGEGSFYPNSDGKFRVAAYGKSTSLSTDTKQIIAREQDGDIILRAFITEDYR